MSGPFADASTGQSYGMMQRANSTWRTPLRAQYHKPATESKPENSGPFALEPSSVAQVHLYLPRWVRVWPALYGTVPAGAPTGYNFFAAALYFNAAMLWHDLTVTGDLSSRSFVSS